MKLYPTGNPGAPVAAVLNTSGGGDIIVARPAANLAPNTSYTFEVTAGLQDVTGVGFAPFTSTFTTGTQVSPIDTSIQFEKVALANVPTGQYTAVDDRPRRQALRGRRGGPHLPLEHPGRRHARPDGNAHLAPRRQRRQPAAHRT